VPEAQDEILWALLMVEHPEAHRAVLVADEQADTDETSRAPRVGTQGSIYHYYVLRYCDVEIYRTARKHGIDNAAIRYAVDLTLVLVDLDPDSDPPKVLAIGPDRAGNLLEVIWLELADDADLVIHTMRLRTAFYELLPTRHGEDTP